jgi:hypothetical protein
VVTVVVVVAEPWSLGGAGLELDFLQPIVATAIAITAGIIRLGHGTHRWYHVA